MYRECENCYKIEAESLYAGIMMDTKSVLSLAINWEKQQREQQLLGKKDENIIDVKPVNLLEQKNED